MDRDREYFNSMENISFSFGNLDDGDARVPEGNSETESSTDESTSGGYPDLGDPPEEAVDRRPQINHIPVNFPGYRNANHDEILVYVISSMQESKKLLIECPSEEERRLAVLCGVLSQKQAVKQGIIEEESPVGTVYYAMSHTSEMDNVVGVLRKLQGTGHLREVQMCILSDGERFYFNEDALLDERNENAFLRLIANFNNEDASPCKKARVEIMEADLVFCLQECILSPVLRQDYEVNLRNCTVIIDEGYEIEKTCCEQASICIKIRDLQDACRLFRVTADSNLPLQAPYNVANILRHMVQSLSSLCVWMADEESISFSKEDILEVLPSIVTGGEEGVVETYLNILQRLLKINNDAERDNYVLNADDLDRLYKIRAFLSIMNLVIKSPPRDFFLKLERLAPVGNQTPEIALKIVCANPSLMFAHDEGPGSASSLIISSSCLAPIRSLRNELGVEFHEEVKIESHEMTSDNYLFRYCSHGPTDVEFALTFNCRTQKNVQMEAGEAVVAACEKIPNGVVILFHEKDYMRTLLRLWGREGILNRIGERKRIISETHAFTDEDSVILLEEYKRWSRSPQDGQTGAVLFALRRGKLYCHEDLKLKGEEIRAVIYVSVPYDSWMVPEYIVAKRQYFEEEYGPNCDENLRWYNSEAFHEMNKSFGDVVQHKDDWGIVLVLDSRVYQKRNELNEKVPRWVKNAFHFCTFQDCMKQLEHFVEARSSNHEM